MGRDVGGFAIGCAGFTGRSTSGRFAGGGPTTTGGLP